MLQKKTWYHVSDAGKWCYSDNALRKNLPISKHRKITYRYGCWNLKQKISYSHCCLINPQYWSTEPKQNCQNTHRLCSIAQFSIVRHTYLTHVSVELNANNAFILLLSDLLFSSVYNYAFYFNNIHIHNYCSKVNIVIIQYYSSVPFIVTALITTMARFQHFKAQLAHQLFLASFRCVIRH